MKRAINRIEITDKGQVSENGVGIAEETRLVIFAIIVVLIIVFFVHTAFPSFKLYKFNVTFRGIQLTFNKSSRT